MAGSQPRIGARWQAGRVWLLALAALASSGLLGWVILRDRQAPAHVEIGPPQVITLGALGRNAIARTSSRLGFALQDADLPWGAPLYLRLVKSTGKLDLFMLKDDQFRLFRRYRICGDSSLEPGPRLAANAQRVPDGLYQVTVAQLSRRSGRYLGVDLGWPNAADQGHGLALAPGSVLIDGRCTGGGSIGLTDQDMEEVFTLTWAALRAGQQTVPLHIFPAPMDQRLAIANETALAGRFDQLRDVWLAGANRGTPPAVTVRPQGYALVP
jgi:murein L,D-transpeptidase YafK